MIEINYFFKWQKKAFIYYAILALAIFISADIRTIMYSFVWIFITFLANLVAFVFLKFISNNKITGTALIVFPDGFFLKFMLMFHIISPLLLFIEEPGLEGLVGLSISMAFMLPALDFFLSRKVL